MPWNDLHAYWRRKHIGARPPSRPDLDPVIEIPWLAKNIFLIDVEPECFKYRLVGSEITRRIGRDPTGQPVKGQLFGVSLMPQWIDALGTVADTHRPQLLLSRMTENLATEMLTLLVPLVRADGELDMILGGCFFSGTHQEPEIPAGFQAVDLRNALTLVA